MSDKFETKETAKAGFDGEDIILEMLKNTGMCWRCKNRERECPAEYFCKHSWKSNRENEGTKKLNYDIAATLHCEQCPEAIEHKCATEEIQRHEVKTNIAAYDVGVTGGSAYTGNVYLELKQYSEDGKKYLGKGWYRKYADAYEQGNKNAFPDWIHFYEPYDHYEREGINRGNGSKSPFIELADDDIIAEWENNPFVDDGEILITKFPAELCISIRGKELYNFVEEHKNDSRYNIYQFKNAILLPVFDIVSFKVADIYSQGNEMNEVFTMQTNGYKNVRAISIWDYVIKGEHGKRRKGILPQWKYKRVFFPHTMAYYLESEHGFTLPFDNRGIYNYKRRFSGKVAYPDTDANKWLQLPRERFLWFNNRCYMWYEQKDGQLFLNHTTIKEI